MGGRGVPPLVVKKESGNDLQGKEIEGVFRRCATGLRRDANGPTNGTSAEDSGPSTSLGVNEWPLAEHARGKREENWSWGEGAPLVFCKCAF